MGQERIMGIYLVYNSRSQFVMRNVKAGIHEPEGRLSCCYLIIAQYYLRVSDLGTHFNTKEMWQEPWRILLAD